MKTLRWERKRSFLCHIDRSFVKTKGFSTLNGIQLPPCSLRSPPPILSLPINMSHKSKTQPHHRPSFSFCCCSSHQFVIYLHAEFLHPSCMGHPSNTTSGGLGDIFSVCNQPLPPAALTDAFERAVHIRNLEQPSFDLLMCKARWRIQKPRATISSTTAVAT